MRITSIEARGFLSLQDFRLADLDPRLTVIVGPNGAGKSSVVRLLDLIRHLLRFSAGDQQAYRRLAALANAGSAAAGGVYEGRVGIELDLQAERHLITTFVRAAAISTILSDSRQQQEQRDLTEIDAQIRSAVTEDALAPLFRGRLVVGFSPRPVETWSLAYEFDVEGNTFTYGLRGSESVSAGAWQHDRLETAPVRSLGSRLWPAPLPPPAPDVQGTEAQAVAPEPKEMPFVFMFDRLLPGSDGVANLRIDSLHSQNLTPTLLDFAALVDADLQRGFIYTGASIFSRIFDRALTIVHEERRPPRREYRTEEIGTMNLGELEMLPLELQRLKNGDHAERARFAATQARFRGLTGRDVDVKTVRIDRNDPTVAMTAGADAEIVIEPQVIEEAQEFPLEFAGAGAGEALIVVSSTLAGSGEVVVLDEPARNLHPTLQRRILRDLATSQAQTIVVTHSAFLVPAQGGDDIFRVVRVDRRHGGTVAHRIPRSVEGDQHAARLRQLMASVDVRALLFASAVVLVEGETEAALLGKWFADTVGGDADNPDALNLVIESVGSDTRFGMYAAFLKLFGIPWVVVADGPVLSPAYSHTLVRQLELDGHNATPAANASFSEWKTFWAAHGVYTLATDFDEEVEVFLTRVGPEIAAEAVAEFPKSKVRQGTYFADAVSCPPEVSTLYRTLVSRLGLI
jgi:predicted ATPase